MFNGVTVNKLFRDCKRSGKREPTSLAPKHLTNAGFYNIIELHGLKKRSKRGGFFTVARFPQAKKSRQIRQKRRVLTTIIYKNQHIRKDKAK